MCKAETSAILAQLPFEGCENCPLANEILQATLDEIPNDEKQKIITYIVTCISNPDNTEVSLSSYPWYPQRVSNFIGMQGTGIVPETCVRLAQKD